MPKKYEVEFANFVLRFGQEYYLLDLFEQIVYPAFTDNSLSRGYGDTSFLFRDVSLYNFGDDENPVLLLAGRYVKNTFEKREQYLDDERDELIRDNSMMQTSPSSIFIIVLNHHRMMFYGETKNAPSLSSFRSTMKNFIKSKFEDYVNECYQRGEATKKHIRNQYFPLLNIISLTSEESIEEFIQNYDLLERVEITLINPNQEIDNDDFFRQLRQKQQSALSEKTSLIYRNKKIGLSLGQISRQAISALNQGNSKLNMKGKDHNGNTLEGNNENLKVKYRFLHPPLTLNGVINDCFEKFNNFVNEGRIEIREREHGVLDKIKQILINRNNNE